MTGDTAAHAAMNNDSRSRSRDRLKGDVNSRSQPSSAGPGLPCPFSTAVSESSAQNGLCEPRASMTKNLRRQRLGILVRALEDVRQRLIQLLLGVADLPGSYTRHPVGDQAIQPARLGQGIVELGGNEVFDRFTQRLGLIGHHGRSPCACGAVRSLMPKSFAPFGCRINAWSNPAKANWSAIKEDRNAC